MYFYYSNIFWKIPKLPILTHLFLFWFVARKGRSFGSLQGIVGWCLRRRYWRWRKNSHQWKEHRCSLRGKFYPIKGMTRAQGSTKQRNNETNSSHKNTWYTWLVITGCFRLVPCVVSLLLTNKPTKHTPVAFGEGDGMYRACLSSSNSGTVEDDWSWNLTVKPVSNVQCAHDAPCVVTPIRWRTDGEITVKNSNTTTTFAVRKKRNWFKSKSDQFLRRMKAGRTLKRWKLKQQDGKFDFPSLQTRFPFHFCFSFSDSEASWYLFGLKMLKSRI